MFKDNAIKIKMLYKEEFTIMCNAWKNYRTMFAFKNFARSNEMERDIEKSS